MYNFRDNVFVRKLNVLYMIVFTVVSFSHMEATSQKWTLALYGHGTLIPIFQNSCFGCFNVYDFSDQFSVLLSLSTSIFAVACIKQEIQMLVIN